MMDERRPRGSHRKAPAIGLWKQGRWGEPRDPGPPALAGVATSVPADRAPPFQREQRCREACCHPRTRRRAARKQSCFGGAHSPVCAGGTRGSQSPGGHSHTGPAAVTRAGPVCLSLWSASPTGGGVHTIYFGAPLSGHPTSGNRSQKIMRGPSVLPFRAPAGWAEEDSQARVTGRVGHSEGLLAHRNARSRGSQSRWGTEQHGYRRKQGSSRRGCCWGAAGPRGREAPTWRDGQWTNRPARCV